MLYRAAAGTKLVDFSTMAKFSRQIETMVYRFIMSLLVGFFLGTYFITNSDNTILKSLGSFMCNHKPNRFINSAHVLTDIRKNYRLNAREGLLYIGMMSTKGNLETRVDAVLNTWAKHPNIRVEIFANNNGTIGPGTGRVTELESGAKIISLPGVGDTTYPPQKKSFSMLKYIHDNHLRKFDWFLRVDDDAYVKVDALTKLLSRIDSSKLYLIGHPGYGKHADDYLFGENYCMGGTGVLFSRETLSKVGPRLSECLQHMYTEHEDIELGRCVRDTAGVSCTNAWETSSLFYQNFNGKGSYGNNLEEISERKRATALTFHANKDAAYQYKLHLAILEDQVTALITKITKMETEAKKMASIMVMRKFDDKAWNARAGYVWDSITQKSIYSARSDQLVRQIPSTIKEAAVRNVFYTIAELRNRSRALLSHIEEIIITNTRYYVNPFTSADMISRLKVRTVSRKVRKSVYLKNVYFRRTFPDSMLYFKEANDIQYHFLKKISQKQNYKPIKSGMQTGNLTRVNFVMALSGRPENLRRFINNYKTAFLAIGENVSLTIVYYPEQKNDVTVNSNPIIDVDSQKERKRDLKNVTKTITDIEFVQSLLENLKQEYPDASTNFLPVRNGLSFSRGAGLQIGAKSIVRDELLFFCDVDLVFSPEILFHIRRSTIKKKQVYYPTFFSQYDPDIVYSYHEPPETSFYFEEIAGFWRTFSYGMVAIYKSDFLTTGGFDLSIRGWGLEDLKFCDAVMKKAGLQVFKANEPAMVHIYHDKDCPSDLTKQQRTACQKSRAQHFGPKTLMYYIWQRERDENDIEEVDPKIEVDNQIQESPVAAK